MTPEADSGPLLSQRPVVIAPEDDAATVYAKVLAIIPDQVESIVRGLANGSLQPQPQNHLCANYWRKRSVSDGQIDWRMGADSIYNLVRALTRPYPGAHFLCAGKAVKLWKCTVADAGALNLEPGKILASKGRNITVKCGTAAVDLIDHELMSIPELGQYLL
jgi:methionyl-tRNA formyltransferase